MNTPTNYQRLLAGEITTAVFLDLEAGTSPQEMLGGLVSAARDQSARSAGSMALAVSALDSIASDRWWMLRGEMVQRAQSALLALGAWRRAKPGEPGSFLA